MKEIQIILAGGVIIAAIYTDQLLFTDKVTIHDLQNVSITNERGERISNAGSAEDVAANYPLLREEVKEAAEAYIEEKGLDQKKLEEDAKLILSEDIKDEL